MHPPEVTVSPNRRSYNHDPSGNDVRVPVEVPGGAVAGSVQSHDNDFPESAAEDRANRVEDLTSQMLRMLIVFVELKRSQVRGHW